MKKFVILITCLALTPLFKGCGGGSSGTIDPPKEEVDRLLKAAEDARAKQKKNQ